MAQLPYISVVFSLAIHMSNTQPKIMKKLYQSIRVKVLMTFAAITMSVSAFSQTDVLVCGAVSPQTWLDDVQNKLIATAAFNTVTTYNTYLTGTPTLAYMQGFDAILVFTDYGLADATTFGNNLAAYIDGGGGVVTSTFANASVLIGGTYASSTYQVCIPISGQLSSPQLTLGTVLVGCSPIMNGITSFNGGTSSYRTNSSSFAAGSVTEATWSNGEWLVATRTNAGAAGDKRRADLNFYPPSNTVRSDFWLSSTQGGEIMANALLWVAGITSSNPPASPAAISGNDTICAGSTSMLSIPPVSGATTYTWTVPPGVTINSGQGTVNLSVTGNSATSSTISVTAGNGCGTSAPTTLSFVVYAQPTVTYNASPGNSVCVGDSLTLNGSGATSYTWTGGVNDGIPFAPSSSGSYTLTGTDTNGCTNTSVAAVTVNALPAVGANTSATSVCPGGQITLYGSGATSYTWSHSVTDSVPYVPTATATYTVTGTDANGCMNTDVVTVTVTAAILVSANATDTALCDGSSVTLTGSGAASYAWSGGVNDGVPFVPTATVTYTLTGTDVNGCIGTDSITVTVNAMPTVAASTSANVLCENDAPATLTGTPAGGMWFGVGVSGNAFDPSASGPGTFLLIYGYQDSVGCGGDDSLYILVNPAPTVTSFASDNNVCVADGSVSLTGTPAGGTWSGPGVTGNSFSPATAGNGTHVVSYTYTDVNGCDATATETIVVSPCTGIAENETQNTYSVYPNPNNGTFTLTVNTDAGDMNIELVDLSGRVVYTSIENNVQSGFQKQIETENLAVGTYMMRVTSKDVQQVIKIVIE